MGEDFIDALSAEDLADYAASESITATVSYTQTDEDGNVINISEEDAEAAVASVGPSPWEDMIDFPGDGGGSGLTPVEENEGTYEEEGLGALGVLKLTFVVSYWGDDKYHFSVDGEWLTMPKYRGYDSLGACAQYMSLPGEGDNASGWYSYESVELAWGEFQDQTTEKYSIPSSSFGRPTTDGWNGVGATFNLPDDDTSMDVPLAEFYYSFKVHIGFDIEVASPDTSWNIDPRATYSQHTLGFDYDAGLKITASGVDAELGLNVAIMKHNYTIRLTNGLDYVPDGD